MLKPTKFIRLFAHGTACLCAILALAGVLVTTGCHTTEGASEDMEEAGDAIEDAAEEAADTVEDAVEEVDEEID